MPREIPTEEHTEPSNTLPSAPRSPADFRPFVTWVLAGILVVLQASEAKAPTSTVSRPSPARRVSQPLAEAIGPLADALELSEIAPRESLLRRSIVVDGIRLRVDIEGTCVRVTMEKATFQRERTRVPVIVAKGG